VSEALGAALVTTRGLGHRRILLDPAVAAAIAEFVADRPACERAGPPCLHPGCGATAAAYGFCEPCALEADLFDRARRWPTVSP
jgi:hypothetical protein